MAQHSSPGVEASHAHWLLRMQGFIVLSSLLSAITTPPRRLGVTTSRVERHSRANTPVVSSLAQLTSSHLISSNPSSPHLIRAQRHQLQPTSRQPPVQPPTQRPPTRKHSNDSTAHHTSSSQYPPFVHQMGLDTTIPSQL